MAEPREIRVYVDLKSPYAFLAKDPARELEREFPVRLSWLPYTLDIPSYLGSVEERTEQQWRKVRYAYMDARRIANRRGLVVLGPRKIYDSTAANAGLLWARREGIVAPYLDRVFERFFRRALDLEDRAALAAVVDECGGDGRGFLAFVDGEARRELGATMEEAHRLGVFGVPTFVLDGELFFGGDRIDFLRARLRGG